MADVSSGRGRPAAPGADDRYAELVAQAATPDALRDNPFRVLGLPTDASAVALRREGERLRILARLAGGEDGGTAGRADAGRSDEAGAVEAALRRLRDPVLRLMDELLWERPDDAPGAQAHNHAVRTLAAITAPDASASAGQYRDAVASMADSLASPATVAYVEQRVRALDDPRVTAADGRALVAAARLFAPVVTLRSAVRLHRAGHTSRAAAVADAAGAARREDYGAAVALVFGPALARARDAAEAARTECRSDPARGAACARHLLEDTAEDRALLVALLADGDHRRVVLADDVAGAVLGCAIAYSNETRDYETTRGLLASALALDPGAAVRGEVDQAIEVTTDNQLFAETYATCWFCKAGTGEPEHFQQVEMYGDVTREPPVLALGRPGRLTWSTRTVLVPRCRACAAEHMALRPFHGAAWLVVGVVVVVAAGVLTGNVAIAAGVALALTALAYRAWSTASKPQTQAIAFPAVLELMRSGWYFGAEPPEAHTRRF